MNISNEEKNILQSSIGFFRNWFHADIVRLFTAQGLGGEAMWPQDWRQLFQELSIIESLAVNSDKQHELQVTQLQLIKRIVMTHRRSEAEKVSKIRDNVVHTEILDRLDQEVLKLDSFIKRAELQNVEPAKLPKLSDFLTISRIEQDALSRANKYERKYDEKFHILQSPELFLSDLEKLRSETDMRGVDISVAFVDIDDFKNVNTKLTETVVDKLLLPKFMQLVESQMHFVGVAYRQGGDEYLIILPGFTSYFANLYMDNLRKKISEMVFPSCDVKLTVSVGICTINQNCPFTNQEVQKLANEAKNYAKLKGKNQCAYYSQPSCSEESLACTLSPE